jgi:hypothetical protein
VTWAAGAVGFVHSDEVERARQAAHAAAEGAASAAREAVAAQLEGESEEEARDRAEDVWSRQEELSRLSQEALLRELSGHPGNAVHIDPAWLELNAGRVRIGAQVISENRSWDELPRLADALEDAGCNEALLLEHFRTGSDHILGCWALDLLLGKE